MADDKHAPEPTEATLKEAKRFMTEAEGHEDKVTLREESARFLDERGESDGAAIERREANLERDAARLAWDRALALQGPTQATEKGLEIPIPTREDFIANMHRVAPPPVVPDPENRSSKEDRGREA